MCQKIGIYKALILSHGYFVFSAGGGGLVFRTTHEVEDCAYEVEDSLGGGGLCTWQRSQVLKWKQLLFALHLYLHSLNCVSFENSILVCLISGCLVTILSFGTNTVHYNFKTDNLLSTCTMLSPIQTAFQHIWCTSQAQFPCYIGVQREPWQAPCKAIYGMMAKCFSARQLKLC